MGWSPDMLGVKGRRGSRGRGIVCPFWNNATSDVVLTKTKT